MSTICVFGDSIVWGEGDPVGGGWVSRLKRYYEEHNCGVSVYNLGIDADTSEWLLSRIESETLAREPDIVVIAIGINDSIYR